MKKERKNIKKTEKTKRKICFSQKLLYSAERDPEHSSFSLSSLCKSVGAFGETTVFC